MAEQELTHHGVKGMKWGVRRYQPYPNGSKAGEYKKVSRKEKKHIRTEAQKKAYNSLRKDTDPTFEKVKAKSIITRSSLTDKEIDKMIARVQDDPVRKFSTELRLVKGKRLAQYILVTTASQIVIREGIKRTN